MREMLDNSAGCGAVMVPSDVAVAVPARPCPVNLAQAHFSGRIVSHDRRVDGFSPVAVSVGGTASRRSVSAGGLYARYWFSRWCRARSTGPFLPRPSGTTAAIGWLESSKRHVTFESPGFGGTSGTGGDLPAGGNFIPGLPAGSGGPGFEWTNDGGTTWIVDYYGNHGGDGGTVGVGGAGGSYGVGPVTDVGVDPNPNLHGRPGVNS